MPERTLFPSAPRPQHDPSKYPLSKTIYAVGIDTTVSPKVKIAQLHGGQSEVAAAVMELESYLANPEFRHSIWFLRFFYRVQRIMGMINSRANAYVKTRMAGEFIDELIHDGYLCCLKSMAVPSGQAYVAFAKSYAETHAMPLAAALLFHPYGGARMALRYFLVAERSHGQHRPLTRVDLLSEKAKQQWFDAGKTINWPTVTTDKGSQDALDRVENQPRLPEEEVNLLRQFWRRNPSLRGYTGTHRLSGDTPFKILEDAVDLVFRDKMTPSEIRLQYDQIAAAANQRGLDPFYAVYKQMFRCNNQLQLYWDRARSLLYEHSRLLWEKQNQAELQSGIRSPAEGVTFRPRKKSTQKPLNQSLPGTIYLNNGRYYWVVKDKTKPVALVDPRNTKLLPGTIGNCRGRYFWIVPGVLKRQRLVAKGEKFSTTDRATAEKIALELWNKIQSRRPKLAAKIKARRAWGTATKDRTIAEKIARKMWLQIQQNDPELTSRILSDHRRVSQDRWIAQICAHGKRRHLGSFNTRKEAAAAYANEFKKVFGYPPGYHVQVMPKLDKVWPTWDEQKVRLKSMDVKPTMPVIGLTDKAKPLFPVIQRMQKTSWLVKHCMVVLEDHTPCAAMDIAIESRGSQWFGEIKQQGRHPVIYGSTAMDRDSRRIRITLFSPAANNAEFLAEEVYHLVYRIIGVTNIKLSTQIQTWYDRKIKAGIDPTLSEDEAFAMTMAQEDCGRVRTDLPRQIVHHAKQIFSDKCRIPNSVLEQIKVDA